MRIRKLGILGGTGFVGGHLVAELTRRRYRTRVLTRRRERHRDLLVFPTSELVEANVHDPDDLATQLEGCDAVVNLVAILNEGEHPGADFRAVHVELPRKLISACHRLGIGRLLHMSALGAREDAPSAYLRSKAQGEALVQAANGEALAVTTFRPSIIFGPGDHFFNRFATLLRVSPLVFPLACPNARFAPVYVGDVARAFADALESKASFGSSYELCGPRVYTLRELVEYTATVAGLRRWVMGLNDRLSRLQARVLERLPGRPFTVDNYLSLQVDSLCQHDGLAALGIDPHGVDAVVPTYIGQRNLHALYNRFRSGKSQ